MKDCLQYCLNKIIEDDTFMCGESSLFRPNGFSQALFLLSNLQEMGKVFQMYSHSWSSKSFRKQFEPRHEISNNMVCANSKGSDQPAHTRSLIRAYASRLDIL